MRPLIKPFPLSHFPMLLISLDLPDISPNSTFCTPSLPPKAGKSSPEFNSSQTFPRLWVFAVYLICERLLQPFERPDRRLGSEQLLIEKFSHEQTNRSFIHRVCGCCELLFGAPANRQSEEWVWSRCQFGSAGPGLCAPSEPRFIYTQLLARPSDQPACSSHRHRHLVQTCNVSLLRCNNCCCCSLLHCVLD